MITIITPVRDRAWILPKFLESLYHMDYPKQEINIIFSVNDSTDESEEMLQQFINEHKDEYASMKIIRQDKGLPKDARTEIRKQIYQGLAEIRNGLLEEALKTDCTHIFSIDSDIVAPPRTIKGLLADKLDCVSAHIYNSPYSENYSNSMRYDGGKYRHFCIPKNCIVEVELTGAIYLFKRELVEKGVRYGYSNIGEDEPFCSSARRLGYKLYTDTRIHADHYMKKPAEAQQPVEPSVTPITVLEKKYATMNVAIVISPNWYEYALIELYALFKTNKNVRVYLISDYIEPSILEKFDSLCRLCGPGYEVKYLNFEKLYQEKIPSTKNVDNRFTKYTLYRLLIPSTINEDRLLYIDADAIVNGDLSEFYNMDLGENLFAGCIDTGIQQVHLNATGLTKTDVYINAGVALWNLKAIRELNLEETWIREINNKYYPCHDQDLINMTGRYHIVPVDPKYNVSLSTSLKVKYEDVKIMHYAGKKPWNTKEVPFYSIWEKWQKEFNEATSTKIPKRIFYCWFGGKEKPPVVQRCINSWKTHMPTWEIIELNESNFDINSNPYVKNAYQTKRYAFVTDYVRLWALYNYGGVYMDSDVEVLKPLDCFMQHRAFTGHETEDLCVTATMGAEAGHPWIKYLLSYYDDATFKQVPNTNIITEMSLPLVEKQEDGFRYLKDGVVIYPVETFCSYDHIKLQPTPTANSYAVHLFAGTWKGRTKI
jgi:lipopolysaccharide biosynthesis glycosyltransferase/GT2 family glycosyltransferase